MNGPNRRPCLICTWARWMTEAHYREPEPLQVIGAIRESFQDAGFVYTNGSCFAFYQILRTIFPQAKPWTDQDHVWTEIDGKFYDVNGVRVNGAAGLLPMADDPAMMARAHGWKWRSRWRVDLAAV